ncbi:terminase large subunit domain-containing protein [Zavarzinella formosa]|uniref:terminase large subunit domain-containing protein n=1 Tax=Zavarzinella formosa TaxID=360055 RepID=UPI0003076B92|nr:terminase family protein [Zavarzinella formosa]
MAVAALRRRLAGLEQQAVRKLRRDGELLERLRDDPTLFMSSAGLSPDPWQENVLRSEAERTLLLCSRQAGKSSVSAALALRSALTRPGFPVLVLSPTLRQSGELFRKIVSLNNALGRPVPAVRETTLQMELANGSRIVSLPGTEGTVRGFREVALLIIDEAARVSDALYYAVRPMLAVSKGRLAALSTPFGQRGWFYDEWHGTNNWKRVRITAPECPRISPEFLAEERRSLGERWYRQEYLCSFEATVDAVFAAEDIRAALSDDVRPLFPAAGED